MDYKSKMAKYQNPRWTLNKMNFCNDLQNNKQQAFGTSPFSICNPFWFRAFFKPMPPMEPMEAISPSPSESVDGSTWI